MRAAAFLIVVATTSAVSADTVPRIQTSLVTIATGTERPVTGNVGLAGVTESHPLPAAFARLSNYSSVCLRQKHAVFVRYDDTGKTSEIVSIGGHEYLDAATVQHTAGSGIVSVDTHTRRAVSRVATFGDSNVWGYRDSGTLHLGAFVASSPGFCQWNEVTITERGGQGSLFLGAGVVMIASVSRSSADAAPILLVRVR